MFVIHFIHVRSLVEICSMRKGSSSSTWVPTQHHEVKYLSGSLKKTTNGKQVDKHLRKLRNNNFVIQKASRFQLPRCIYDVYLP